MGTVRRCGSGARRMARAAANPLRTGIFKSIRIRWGRGSCQLYRVPAIGGFEHVEAVQGEQRAEDIAVVFVVLGNEDRHAFLASGIHRRRWLGRVRPRLEGRRANC